MSINVSSWSIRNPLNAIVIFILLTLLGLYGFNKMRIQNMPDMDLPIIRVNIIWQGASPEQLEAEVARKIENVLANINNLRHIYTNLYEGHATVVADFELEKPVIEALDDVRNAVDSIRSELPREIEMPIISRLPILEQPMAGFSITSTQRDITDLSWFVDDQVNRSLMKVPGVGKISRIGGVDRQIQILLDTEKMNGLGIGIVEVNQRVSQNQREFPGGVTRLLGQEQSIRVIGSVNDVAELGLIKIAGNGHKTIRLQDIASIKDTIAEPRSVALVNGNPAIAFDVFRSKGASEVNVLAGLRQAVNQLQRQYPDINISEIYETAQYVENDYHDSIQLLFEGSVLAIIVVWLFLRDRRATFIAAIALPLSIIPAFWPMSLMGFSLNLVSLLSLSLVIGVLVDDAIVEVENIVRHMNQGKTPYQAAMEGAREIGLAVVATTMTLVAVFLPTAFMPGIVGRFFVQFGFTASIAVLFSLLVARLLTPMMCAYLLKMPSLPENAHSTSRLLGWYLQRVSWCLTRKYRTLLVAVLFFAVSLVLALSLSCSFINAADLSHTTLKIELPTGHTLDQTREIAERVHQLVLANESQVKEVFSAIGDEGVVNKARLEVELIDRHERHERQGEIESRIRRGLQQIAGARISVGNINRSERQFNFAIQGDNTELLYKTAGIIEEQLRTIQGIGLVTSNVSLLAPQLVIRPDFAKAAAAGITTRELADTIRIATNGDYSMHLTKLNLPERQVPIVIRLANSERESLPAFENIRIRSAFGLVPLASIADIQYTSGSTDIKRLDRLRSVTFNIETNQLKLGEIAKLVHMLPIMQNLPEGVIQQPVGDAQMMVELFEGFTLAIVAGGLAIYLVLVVLFKDFIQPLTILMAIPLASGGAFIALFLADYSLSMSSLIGLIMLMGIVTKNSILLVDYTMIARNQGLSRHEALLDACRKRSRPIIMTSLAMIAGMLPAACGLGSEPSFRAPMAFVVIGGLITSTILSLFVVPVVYVLLDNVKMSIKRLFI